MKTPRIIAASLASCLLVTASFGASDYFLKIEGVEGESKAAAEKDHKGWIEISSVSIDRNDVVAPRDAASGLATGKRQHKPVTFSKPVDKATPVFAKALSTGRVFKKIEIGGPEGTYVLSDATVASITPSSGGDRPSESVSFNYTKIEFVTKEKKPADVRTAAPAKAEKATKPEAKRAPN